MKREDNAILYEVKDEVAHVTINQPEKMNRLRFRDMLSIVECLEKAANDPEVKVLLLKGAGEKAFCAGASIDEFEQASAAESAKNLEAYAQLCRAFLDLSKPSIAMIRGYALAGGCGLAMLPTFSIASEKAVFGLPEIKIGFWPMMVMAILFRTVGRKKGLELICTGDFIDAREAERIGMITRAVPDEDLESYVKQLIEKLRKMSISTLQSGLQAYRDTLDMEYDVALNYLRDKAAILSTTHDAVEGTRAFVEKRTPKWER